MEHSAVDNDTTAYMDACISSSIAYADRSLDGYYSASTLQEGAVVDPSITTSGVLLAGLSRPKALTTELNSSLLLLTTFDGLVLKIGLPTILERIAVESAQIIPSISVPEPFFQLHTSSLLVDEMISEKALPEWISVLTTGPSKARFDGICGVPVNYAMGDTFNQERVLVADTNQQFLIALDDYGSESSLLDIHTTYKIKWPSQLLCSYEASTSTIEVYVSEYLGRVWKIQFVQNSVTGKIDLKQTVAPSLVIDKSTFPASAGLRKFLNNARDNGEPGYSDLFFEIAS